MSTDALRKLARRHIEQVWGVGDHAGIDALYAEDVVDHAPAAGQSPGRAGLHEVMDAFTAAFPDLHMELHHVLGEADPAGPGLSGTAVDSWTLRATHTGPFLGVAPTGLPVVFRGTDVLRVSGGVVREVWHVEDFAAALRQLATPGGTS